MLAILLSEKVFFSQDHEGPATHLAAKCCEVNSLRPLDRGLLVGSGHSNLPSSPTEIRKRTFRCVHLDPVSGLASKVERVDVSSETPGHDVFGKTRAWEWRRAAQCERVRTGSPKAPMQTTLTKLSASTANRTIVEASM